MMNAHKEPTDYSAAACCLLTFAAFALTASPASAQTIGDILCSIYINVIYADIGRGVATLAIVTLGIGALFGKVSWGMAVMVAAGIGAIFGAVPLYNAIFGGAGMGSCPYPA